MATTQATQELLHSSQAALDAAIAGVGVLAARCGEVSGWACNQGLLDQRDTLTKGQAYLQSALSSLNFARAELGQLSFPGNIETQSGGK